MEEETESREGQECQSSGSLLASSATGVSWTTFLGSGLQNCGTTDNLVGVRSSDTADSVATHLAGSLCPFSGLVSVTGYQICYDLGDPPPRARSGSERIGMWRRVGADRELAKRLDQLRTEGMSFNEALDRLIVEQEEKEGEQDA